jgi:multidrug efflux pump subunit AcrA (membrane-fusion protein)
MKNFFVLAFALFIFLPSCKPKQTKLVTTDLSRTDFTEIITVTGTIQPVNSLSIMAPRDYDGSLTIGWVRPEGSRVVPGDSICVLKCDDMIQMLDDQVRNLETLKADYKRLEADNALNLAVLEARLKENQAGMSISQLDSVQMNYAPPVKKQLMKLELEKLRVQERKLQKKFLAEKAIDETEIRQMNSRIIQAENQVQDIREKVKGLTIYSTTTGILAAAEATGRMIVDFGDGNTFELGGYPRPGSMLFSEIPLMMVPDLSEMQVKIEMQEVDYKRIEKGQKVTMIIDAANGLKTTGSIKTKSMAAKTKYISAEAKFNYFDIVVSVDSCHSQMPPGLSARCTILVNQVRDTIVVPSLAIFERDSVKVVYVAEGRKFRPMPVETGLSSSSQTIISKGLSGKETIALVEPSQNYLVKKKE